MSNRVRVRSRGVGGYLNSRGGFITEYKMPSNFSSKSREEKHSEDRRRDRSLDKRKGEDNRKGEHHRDSSKSNGRHKEYKESFSSRENRESFMPSKDARESFSSRGGRDSYSSRDADVFSSRDRESYSSRGEHNSFSIRGRESYSNRGSRGSFSSRGGFEQFSSRGNRESYSNRGSRMTFSSRGGHESYPSRGGREQFSSRGRESFSSRGNRDQFSLRGGRESFSSRGKDSYSSRGGRESFSTRGGREYFSTRGFGRGMFRGSLRGSRSGSSFLGHRTQLEMTKKLVASVLKTDDSMGEHISYRPREEKGHSFGGRELKDARRSFGQDVERRSFKESRAQRSWNQDERPLKRESLSTKFKNEHLYSSKMDKYGGIRKRVAEIDEPEPSSKRLRLNDVGRFRGMMQKRFYESSHDKHALSSESDDEGHSRKESRDKHREILEAPSEKTKVSKKRTTSTSKHSRERSRSCSLSQQDIKDKRKCKDSEKEKVKDDKESKEIPTEEVEEETIRLKIKDDHKKESSKKFSSDEEEENPHEKKKKRKERSPSGMQVTIRSDGERAVNNDGHVKSRLSSGKVFVDLRCPHCPGHTSVTFQEYRFHLETKRHNYFLNNVVNKHSIVLRRIRLQQRNEQREIEEKLEKENPEEFASCVSKYCHTCKLAFKVNEEDIHEGYAEHNATKLHKMQKTYLFPRCVMCRMSFPSRLVYEYHVASIRHLRMKTLTMEHTGKETIGKTEDEEIDFAAEEDLANFVTMDSVGEDEIGSEHDEITGNREDVEAAEQEAKADDEEEEDDEDDEYFEEVNLDEEECDTLRRRAILEEDPIELDITTESEHLEELKDVEILGRDYICAIEASYCKLCNKAIRTDSSIGVEAIDQHCRTAFHLENYHYLQSEEFMDEHGEGFEEANRLEEDYLADEDDDELDNVEKKRREVIEGTKDTEKKDAKKDSVDNTDKVGTLNSFGTERLASEAIVKDEKIIKEEVKSSVSMILKEEEDFNLATDSSVESKEVEPESLFEEIGEQLDEPEIKNTKQKAKQVKSTKEEPKAKDSGTTKKPLKLTRRKTIPTKLSSKT